MAMRLSTHFRSLKNPHHRPSQSIKAVATSVVSPEKNEGSKKATAGKGSSWSVYLIVSSRLPRTYVGVTTDLSRRLKQHNGELKGGAKASRAGKPWSYACIIQGFIDQSEACEFEAKWKSVSRKLPRKCKKEDSSSKSKSLLQHREEALDRAKRSFDYGCLQIHWYSFPAFS